MESNMAEIAQIFKLILIEVQFEEGDLQGRLFILVTQVTV